MSQDIYAAIQAQAPGGSPAAAGNLHEDIWVELLRRSDPTVHNVRVTAGDGGIDGVGFQDPVTGEATVYQCKFFKELSPTHREEITEAFVRACAHPFACNTWVLLLPRQLSAPDLGWVMSQLRNDARALIKELEAAAKLKLAAKGAAKVSAGKAKAPKLPRINLHAATDQRVAGCAIRYREGQDLEDLLRDNLDVAGRYLPDSALALSDELAQERSKSDADRRNGWNLLRELRGEAIRAREVETRRARAAVGILNQGWGGMAERLRLMAVNERLPGANAAAVAVDVEALAGARSSVAFECEGLIAGVSDAVSQIYFEARMLQSVAGLRDLNMADGAGVKAAAIKLRGSIEGLQQKISAFTRTTIAVQNAVTAPTRRSRTPA